MSSEVTLSISCTETELETVSEKLHKAGIDFIVEKNDLSNEPSSMQSVAVDELRNDHLKRREVSGSGLRLVFVGVSDRSSSSSTSITSKASEKNPPTQTPTNRKHDFQLPKHQNRGKGNPR